MELSELKIVHVPIEALIPYANNARTHSSYQVAKIASSIKEFGFNDPIAIDGEKGIIAGHGRLQAARLLGLREVPTIQLGHLSKDQQKAYIIAHNRIAADAGWDSELLKIEINELRESGYNLEETGFSDAEIKAYLKDDLESMVVNEKEKIDEEKSIKCPKCNHEFIP